MARDARPQPCSRDEVEELISAAPESTSFRLRRVHGRACKLGHPCTPSLVTGATGFLGYHVVNAAESVGIRPRVLERRESRLEVLDRLDVERAAGHLEDPAAVRAACAGVDTLLHLAFKVSVGRRAAARSRRCSGSTSTARGRCCRPPPPAACGVPSWPAARWRSASTASRRRSTSRASWSQHAFDLPVRDDPPAGRARRARPSDAALRRHHRLPGVHVRAGRSRRARRRTSCSRQLISGKLPFTLTGRLRLSRRPGLRATGWCWRPSAGDPASATC